MGQQITQTISYHYDNTKIMVAVEEACVVTWTLICERKDISELECLMASTITRLNDYGLLIVRVESRGEGQAS